jgi:hypothetical protein
MAHRGASRTTSADTDVCRGIEGLVNAPREYLKRREAEELQDVQAESKRLRAALLAESKHRSGGSRKTLGLVRKVRYS